jgi:hypothetical protein
MQGRGMLHLIRSADYRDSRRRVVQTCLMPSKLANTHTALLCLVLSLQLYAQDKKKKKAAGGAAAAAAPADDAMQT